MIGGRGAVPGIGGNKREGALYLVRTGDLKMVKDWVEERLKIPGNDGCGVFSVIPLFYLPSYV